MWFRKQSTVLTIAVSLILLAGIIYYFLNIRIPQISSQVEEKVRREIDVNAMPKVRVAVVADESGIPKYTQINDEIIKEKIKYVEIPQPYVAQGAVFDTDIIKGKVTKEDIRIGEQIIADSFSTEKKWFGDYDRLKEYAVKSIVAGEVRAGNIVDLVVSYDNGRYDVVVPKTKIRKLIKGDLRTGSTTEGGVSEVSTDNEKYTIIVAVDEVAYRDLELASKAGKIETRLYIDEAQPASKKSFNFNAIFQAYSAAVQKSSKPDGNTAPILSPNSIPQNNSQSGSQPQNTADKSDQQSQGSRVIE